ncbi:hypothetical protein I3F60_02080 [Streptomyces sp. MUM 136J]|uniref:hypothetical protein n=1 Tax=Streptomyces sp. MUM 136J TaxID=2791992 RepID=UPI001F036E5E|nr:hypothetical protein [Streptomyces sp. MUM 136J]MCH0568066.1 hypothetical protein [Streptomyces sp. MUM 136J]
MTQSGQGEEPSAQRPAREGVVLPSDGGAPLLPDPHGGGQQAPHPAGPQPDPYGGQGGAPGTAPSGGQAWGSPWGPGQHQQPQADQQHHQPQADQGWQQPAQSWSATPAPSGAGPLPPEVGHPPAYGGPDGPQAPGYGYPGAPQASAGPSPAYGYPPAYPAHGAGGTAGNGYGAPAGGPSAHLPAAAGGATPYPPHTDVPAHPPAPGAAEGATQFLPPVAAPSAHGAHPPQGAYGAPGAHAPHTVPDEAATRFIPPVGPGALPPEAGADPTRTPGRAAPPAAGADAEATQYIAPVPAQPDAPAPPYGGMPGEADRQPPVEFDNLFRNGPGGDGPAGATQQMPRVRQEEPGYAAQPAFIPSRPGRDDDGGDERRRGGGTGSRWPLIAAIGVGIAVLGVGAGAMLGSSGGDDGKGDGSANVAASASATTGAPSPAADPAEQQAVALDKLLADSGSSRAAVIKAVADVKDCRNLGQAAADLRAAAEQRTDLVTRLGALQVGRLPEHAALTGALTNGWKASASADNHYAAWADEVAGDQGKLCKKGHARSTGQTQAGNRASGTASTQKKTASELWNVIAGKYGLTQRQATQL